MPDTAGKFSWLVRLGYAARGVVYLLLGWLALGTRAKPAAGGQSVLDALHRMPLGTALLAVMTAGLVCYAGFKLLCAVADVEHRGTDFAAILARLGNAASSIGYSFLAWTAVRFAIGAKHAADAGQSQHTAHTALEWSVGGVAIGLVGAGFLAGAALQAKGAITAGFMDRVSSRAPGIVEVIGRAGYAARGIVFAIVGWSLVKAAWFRSSGEAKGLGQALMSLRSSGLVYTFVAAGLLLFGAFSLIVAWYRIVPRIDAKGLKPAFG